MKKLVISLLSIYLVACGASENKESESSASADDVENSCLAELVEGNQIEKMITASELAEIVGEAEADLELKDNKSSSAKYSTMAYNWETDEERLMVMEIKTPKAGGGEHVIKSETPVSNKVIFGNIDVLDYDSPREYFKRTYGPKTKKEKDKAKEAIDQAKKDDDEVDEKSAKTIKSMVDKQSASEVEGVGDLAYWSKVTYSNVTDVKLHVLHGDTMFVVSADVSADTEEDLEVAKKVAQKIIASCD